MTSNTYSEHQIHQSKINKVSGASLTDSKHSCVCKSCCPALNAAQPYIYRHDLAFWLIWNIVGRACVHGAAQHCCSRWRVTFPTAAVLKLHYSHVCYLCDWMINSILLTGINITHYKYLKLVHYCYMQGSLLIKFSGSASPEETVGEVLLKNDELSLCYVHHAGLDLCDLWPHGWWIIWASWSRVRVAGSVCKCMHD